ncbi:tRNA-dihydrouridine synthase [Candidatus Babeliales bacterium]|nr:tRNA-dihydrouridine synthase [Candidatus Babeliales bacterium]MBP9843535.1 tRNA-dihydrouridine synthase [Candidatus Babeliales bacterium]
MNFWQEDIKIGNVSVPRFIGGPLDGITDAPFRQLVRQFSQRELLYTEMRHVRSILTPIGGKMALNFEQMERPLSFQVSASSDDYIQAACEKIVEAGVDIIDLNVGCPAKNVISSCCGSALMAHPDQLEKILKTFRASLNIPFTVKIRAGFKEKNAVDIAKLVQDCGADAIAIHPRLQTQKFAGLPDYEIAAQVKQALQIPVIFSGNVVNFKTAQMTYDRTGVDGFLIGRGMWAKPWKLHEMAENAAGREFHITSDVLLSVALQHLQLMIDHYGIKGLYCFRKHLPFYIKGHPSASALRSKLVVSTSQEEIVQGLVEFLGS